MQCPASGKSSSDSSNIPNDELTIPLLIFTITDVLIAIFFVYNDIPRTTIKLFMWTARIICKSHISRKLDHAHGID